MTNQILLFTRLSIEKEFTISTLRMSFLAYSLGMDAFILLNIEGASNGKMKPRVLKIAIEITREYQLTKE